MRWDHVDCAGGQVVFYSADRHFQFAFHDESDLFMDMMVFRGGTALLYLPEGQGATVAMDHFACKARECLFAGDIAEVLHIEFFCRKYIKTSFFDTRSSKQRSVCTNNDQIAQIP